MTGAPSENVNEARSENVNEAPSAHVNEARSENAARAGSPYVNMGLVHLAFRRALAPAVIVAWAVLVILLLTREGAGSNALLQAVGEGGDPGTVARGMVREGAWTILAIAIVPLLVARSGRVVSVWRSGEAEWLASRPASRGTILVSTWLGTWTGGALLFLLSFIAIEIRAGLIGPVGDSGPHGLTVPLGSPVGSLRRAGAIALPASPWIDASNPLAWTAADPGERAAAGAHARVELGFGASAGAAVEVVFSARRERAGDGALGEERSSRVHVSSRGAIEVALPPGPGNVRFELFCARPGARAFVISDAVEIWIPCASDRAAGAEILLRVLLALAAWTALAIGLSAWVSAPTAAFALLAAWIPAWLGDLAPTWLPGADLWDALDVAGSGRVPATLDPRAFAVGAALAAAGLALAAAGLRRWRSST